MFEGIITNILNKILGEFIEGIKAEQLSISMLSGDVELFNLAIKPDILDNMPLPFKLKYGKVGRIFVDVPVTSILSSPLKIELSEIFMLVEPKEVEEWNEKVIEDAFINSTQSSLENLEEYFRGKLELQNSDPGMATNMINKIIDNIQIDIRNVYLRFEDSISNPKMPYALGLGVEAIQLYTCNENWKRAFVTGKDISLKMAKITNFQIYLNFSDEKRGMITQTKFDDLTEDIEIEDVTDTDIRKIIENRQEKGVKPNPTIVRAKKFLLEEITKNHSNRNLVERFCIEARVKFNKDPKKNQKPMLDVNVVIGGKFKEGVNELEESEEGIGFFKLQKQQMTSILKFLDFSTNYTKFQTGVQKRFLENKLSKDESRKYMKVYEEWKMNEGEDKSNQEKKKAKKLREDMYDIEKNYSYESIAAVRQIAINKYNLEYRKKQERENMHRKIKAFEAERASGYFSGLWGGKTNEQKTKDDKEVQEYKEKLNKEFEEKFADEEQKVDDNLENLLENEPIFDQNALQDMPNEWVQFIAALIIPKLRFVMLDEDSVTEKEKALMELQSSGMRTKAYIGQDWQEIQLRFGKLNVIDNTSGSDIYQFLTETVFPGGAEAEGKDAIYIDVKNNPRFEDGEIKVKLCTKAHQYVFLNMNLINEIQEFFAVGQEPEDQVDLSYYTDRAKNKALEYVNQGADYLEEVSKTDYVHKGIELDLEVFAPVIIIPESICDLTDKKTLVFNLGYIRITSDLIPYHKDIDYKKVNRGEELYDQYDLKLNGFQLTMIEELVDYKRWDQADRKIDIINQISINMKANRSVEPYHPKFPGLEAFCKIHDIDIYFSDYIMANCLNIQNALFPPEEVKAVEEGDDENQEDGQGDNDKEVKRNSKKGSKNKKFKRHSKGRTFEISSEEEDGEDEEGGDENADGTEDENANIGDIKNLDMKSISDVENHSENNKEEDKEKADKVDIRALIFFDRMNIKIGEVVSKEQLRSGKYDDVIDTHRSEIPHVNILEMNMEGLEIEFDQGTSMKVNLIMSRLYMKDLQRVKDTKNGMDIGTKSLIPSCYQMILSNPEIEKEREDGSSHYSMNTRTVKTEDFKSIRGDDEESIIEANNNDLRSSTNQLMLSLKIQGQTTSVEFIFSNLRLIVTLPILERLAKFQGKIASMQQQSEDEKIKAKIDEVGKILNRADEDEESEGSDIAQSQEKRLEKTKDILLKSSSELKKKDKNDKDSEKEKGYFERLKEERNKHLMKGKKLKIKIVEQVVRMLAKGRMKNFEMWIPLESTNEFSRVLSLSLSTQLSFKQNQVIRHKINEVTKQTMESIEQKNQQDANLMINQLSMMMINRHLMEVQEDLTSEKILLPSRLGIVLDKYINAPKDSDITNIEMTIEPFDLKVGFRELDNFKKLGETLSEFSQRISEQSPNQDEQEGEGEGDEKDRTGVDYDQKVPKEELRATERELIRKIEEKDQVKPKKSIKDMKHKQLIKLNFKLVSESINFSLMDDTGKTEYPLVNFNISKIIASVENETGRDDAVNFILKKMGISPHPNLKLEAGLLLEANYFNLDSGSYEPLLEPWTFNAMLLQKTANSAQKVELRSEEMMNINLTFGMALAVKRILSKLSLETSKWEDEKKVAETKTKSQRYASGRHTTSGRRTDKSEGHKSFKDVEDDEDSNGFIFKNYIGMGLRITMEDHDSWKEQGITLSEEDEDTAVINFQEWEERGENNVRNIRELHKIIKHVKKEQNNGKLVENFEEDIIRYDVFIEGFEPITGVPVEISGVQAYELTFEGETEKQAKRHAHQYSLLVRVAQEGAKKIVSFESQLVISNKTEFDLEIAQVLTEGRDEDKKHMTEEEIEKCVSNIKKKIKEENGGDRANLEKYEDLVLFETVFANDEFRVPLRWFLDRVAIYYKVTRDGDIFYTKMLPDLKWCFLQKEKVKPPYENLDSYYLLSTEGRDNTYVAMDMLVNKTRPTSIDRPPQFNCTLKPPSCFNNMMFNDLKLYRCSDEKHIMTIKPGGYSYLYEGLKHEHQEHDDEESEEEQKDPTKTLTIRRKREKQKEEEKEKKLNYGEVKLNKFIWRFEDDGNVLYESIPDYLYSCSVDTKFYCADTKSQASQDGQDSPIALKYEAIKFNTFIYTPYMIVNKTHLDVNFAVKGKKKETARLIQAHTNEFFNPKSTKHNKCCISVKNYDWGEPFDISTLGMSGEVSLKREKDYEADEWVVQKYNSNNLTLGVLISTLGSPFGKTTCIKFVPRYTFVNHCKHPVILAQSFKNATKQYWIEPEESFSYHFENKGKEDNFVKIREPREGESKDGELIPFEQTNYTDWSSKFSIDDFEDFQVSVQSKARQKEEEEIKELNVQTEGENYERLEKENMGEVKWYEPSEINHYRRFIRVIITTQDEATLYIMLCTPNMPEYRINNFSSKKVTVYQKDAKESTIPRTCKKAVQEKSSGKGKVLKIHSFPIPFVWDDQTSNDKKIYVEIEGQKREYDLDEIEDKKEFVIKRKKYFIKLISTGYFRELEIRDKKSNKEKIEDPSDMLKSLMLSNANKKNAMEAKLDLRGVGISIVDKEPKEILYISIFKIEIKYKNETEDKGKGVIEDSKEIDLVVYHMQIDNMVSLENPILFSPEKILDKEEVLNSEEYTPFFQLKVSYDVNKSAKVSRERIEAFQVAIQKMKVEVETGTLNTIINTVTEISNVFGDENTEYLSAQTVKERQQSVTDKDSKDDRKSKKGKEETKGEEDGSRKDEGENGKKRRDTTKSRKDADEDNDFRKEDICSDLDTSSPTPPELSSVGTNKLYFKMIHIGAIKINVTLRFEKKALDFDLNQGFGALTIVYTLVTSIANVSDAPLSFKELLITNIFQSQASLINMLSKNFIRQGMFQFYKLIGSSDMLGNPVGFVDKLGSGVFEFFNEPRQGLIKGPKEFVGGVGKGVTSLVTSVVSASFDSVSKISGSLYSVAKNVTGQETLPQKRSENAVEGVYDGVVGGGKEIVGGITGVFTKPFTGAKQEGAKGFFKGVGKGVLGFVVSPVTAVLKAGHSVSQGVTNTAIRIRRGKLPQYGRFRHPRYIGARNILEPYDEEFAEANQILLKVENGKFSKQIIKYFADFPLYKNTKSTGEEAVLIVTDKNLLFCKDVKKLMYNTQLADITDIAVYEGGLDDETQQKLYHLYIYSRRNKNHVFETVQYALIDKTYSIISKEKASKGKMQKKIKQQK